MRGIDNRPVQPSQETKSIGAEDTFPEDLTTIDAMNVELDKIAATVHIRLTAHELKGRTITLKIKYSDFRIINRSKSFKEAANELSLISDTAKGLLAGTEPEGSAIRLLGITVSNFGAKVTFTPSASSQLPLFTLE